MANSLFQSLHISSQDLSNRLMDLDTISNNLANINTAGFKGTRLNFQELISAQNLDGSKLNSSQVLTGQGDMKLTDNPYDWAIEGDGFFPVTTANGQKGYTRDGMFHIDSSNQMVNSSGDQLTWSGKIPTEAASISIASNGDVSAVLKDGTTQPLGNVQLARFPNPTALINAGNNVWIAGDSSGEAQLSVPGKDGCGTIQSHAYEASNVNLADEMTHMLTDQRGFQMTSRVFQQTDTMINEAIHMRKA